MFWRGALNHIFVRILLSANFWSRRERSVKRWVIIRCRVQGNKSYQKLFTGNKSYGKIANLETDFEPKTLQKNVVKLGKSK